MPFVDIVDEHKMIEEAFVVVDDTFVVGSFAVVEEGMLPEVVGLVANYLNKKQNVQCFIQCEIDIR